MSLPVLAGGVPGALARYRVIAVVTSAGLLVLTIVGLPLKYAAGSPGVVAVVGTLHGFLYIAYLLLTLDLAFRLRWPLVRLVLTCLAGTIPFLGFVAERRTTADVTRLLALRAGSPTPAR